MKNNRQTGSVLVAVLIFVLVMTILILSAAENNLIEIKSSQYFYDKENAFEIAEAGLISEEAKIRNLQSSNHIELIDVDECGKKRYRVSSSAEYYQAKVALQSIYDYLPSPTTPNCLKEKINQRVFWRDH